MLNADASAGSIRVEVLDSDGRSLEGYGAKDRVPVTGDSVRHNVRWKGEPRSGS